MSDHGRGACSRPTLTPGRERSRIADGVAPRRSSRGGGAPTTERTSNVPAVTVQQSPRDRDTKRRLVAGITQPFVDAYAVRPEQVQVFIYEVDHENWGREGSSRSTPRFEMSAVALDALQDR
jgi:phenylpyruvate tautomerase PptA (4-oxalocrotonate tautomerase family)